VLPFIKCVSHYCNTIPVVQMALHCNITVLIYKCTDFQLVCSTYDIQILMK